MPLPLEQSNICVVADNNIKIAEAAGLLEKSHMARVKPIVTARDHNFFPARRGRHPSRFGKATQFVRGKKTMGDIISGKSFPAR